MGIDEKSVQFESLKSPCSELHAVLLSWPYNQVMDLASRYPFFDLSPSLLPVMVISNIPACASAPESPPGR